MADELETPQAGDAVADKTPAASLDKTPATNAAQPTNDAPEVEEVDKLPAWAQKLVKDLRKEAAGNRKAKADAEAAAKAESEKKLLDEKKYQELAEKREKELENIKQQLKAKELDEQRRTIALKVGLPEQFAKRIAGETPEEMQEDAKTMLEALPAKPGAHHDAEHGKGKGDATRLTDEEKQALADKYGVRPEFIQN
jgi:hypothetical protein